MNDTNESTPSVKHVVMPVSDTPMKPLTIDDIQEKAIPERFKNQTQPEFLMDNFPATAKVVNVVMPISNTPMKPLTIDDVLGKVKDLKANDNVSIESNQPKNK